MSNIPGDLRYTKEHEWVRTDSETTGFVGITDFAQDQLGDIVYMSLPEIGNIVTQSEKMGEVESVKSVSDLFSPVSGEILEVNQEVLGHPELVNEEPYERGWLIRLRPSDPSEDKALLNAQDYQELLDKLAGDVH